MSTLSYPTYMHPWFRVPSQKRRASEADSSSSASDASDVETCPRAPKRRKCDVLENGIAHLSLNTQLNSPIVSSPSVSAYPGTPSYDWSPSDTRSTVGAAAQVSWNSSSAAYNGPQAVGPVLRPGSVEEPPAPEVPDIPEVTMRGQSWYEPEKDRIVVTDLDDSDAEDSPDDPFGLSVNSALMDRIKSGSAPLAPLPIPDSSKALVLFRPLAVPDSSRMALDNKARREKDQTDIVEDIVEDIFVDPPLVDDDDAMDIEPF
ncbi:hypothetical protein PHLCEN_2v353 [Hermanssonia centrifuga]|uniref:Uncharacterized protein n=1 Tax=Hermanssonia centrifuga TaxID=98765 RepID=A0A2R6S6J8_9APHY|nr:hypothetical protein PHLCEN_2v353 [Hermanssonia centrifuga]